MSGGRGLVVGRSLSLDCSCRELPGLWLSDMNYESQGHEWLAKGDKKLRSLGWFGNKNEEAAECYERAANQFKLAKSCACRGGRAEIVSKLRFVVVGGGACRGEGLRKGGSAFESCMQAGNYRQWNGQPRTCVKTSCSSIALLAPSSIMSSLSLQGPWRDRPTCAWRR